MRIPPPGMEMGQLAKKLGWKGKYMDSGCLDIISKFLKMPLI